jgi:hypothetical protein
MLRIGNGTEIDIGLSKSLYIIREDIPKCNFFTLTLEMNEDKKAMHDDITLYLLSLLSIRSSSSNNDNKKDGAANKCVASTEADRQEMRNIIESKGIID